MRLQDGRQVAFTGFVTLLQGPGAMSGSAD
jgi:hypothetical protein